MEIHSAHIQRTLMRFAATMIAGAICIAPAFASGSFQTLLALKGVSNGGQPWATPIVDSSGNLYGTTSEGGNGPCISGKITLGCGTVYELIAPTTGSEWTETLIYQFQGGEDGNYPVGGLVFDGSGNLYGTTEDGGTSGSAGTVFESSPPSSGSGPWTLTTIYNFAGGVSGANPEAGLVFDESGNLYGTATWGGNCDGSNGCGGVVYELSPPSVSGGQWTYTVIYTFKQSPDGAVPQSTLVFVGKNLFGTTVEGGKGGSSCELDANCGTIFELAPPSSSGGTWTEHVLHSFGGVAGDGQNPRSGLVRDSSGNLYGVTEFGGTYGYGTVYEFAPPSAPGGSWTETVLNSFSVAVDGADPFPTPAIGPDGSLYGTTMFGGPTELGNVFQLSPPASSGDPWVETVLYNFTSKAYPIAGLTFGKAGWLYGATLGGQETENCSTSSGGGQALGCGVLFRVLP